MRVFLVEDHPAVREGLALVLGQKGFLVAGHADGLAGTLAALAGDTAFDVAVVDLTLEGESGLEVVDQLRQRAPGIPAVVYSMHEEAEQIREALAHGARGYVTKRDPVDLLVEGLLAVVAGKSYLSPRAAQSLERAPVAETTSIEVLPPRERRIFALLGEGYGVNEIAAQLSLSSRTVEAYCERVQNRFGLLGMRELRRHAIKLRGS